MWFWEVGSCIWGLLPKGGFEVPYLGEVPRHQKKKNYVNMN